jgi:hypothetical protein
MGSFKEGQMGERDSQSEVGFDPVTIYESCTCIREQLHAILVTGREGDD